MQLSTFRTIFLPDVSTEDAPPGVLPIKLVAAASGVPMRVLARTFVGLGPQLALAYDQTVLANINDSNPVVPGDAFLMTGTDDFVFILAPGQRLYCCEVTGTSANLSVAISEAAPLQEVLNASTRAMGTPSRLTQAGIPKSVLLTDTDINNPATLVTAPNWSPLRVTINVNDIFGVGAGVTVGEDETLLTQGQGFSLLPNEADTFILAPGQTLYGVGTGNLGFNSVPINISTTLFTDVFSPNAPRQLSRKEQERILWNNLWQGGDGVCF